uniref:Mitochondrial ribosomal protein S31 n=1 Tax=Macaca mulatta TaxID=9544 RepID=A0A5F7ZV77_MACMU
ERAGTCLAAVHAISVAFLVHFVSRRCFLESRRSYLFASFPATLCPLEARRHQRLRLCYSLLGTERSGIAVQRFWFRRSSGNPVPGPVHFSYPPTSWSRYYYLLDLRSYCFKSEEREIPERKDDLPKVIVCMENRATITSLVAVLLILHAAPHSSYHLSVYSGSKSKVVFTFCLPRFI